MDITNEIVAENNITTMMITHNMSSALATGDRTIMMDSGRIIIDLDKGAKVPHDRVGPAGTISGKRDQRV